LFCQWYFGHGLQTWAIFVELTFAALIVIVAGARFTKLADVLADRLQIGGGWIGLILLATVTSLPELVSSGTATYLNNIDLALGGLLGSCSFNITLIFVLNALSGGGSVLRNVSPSHTLSSAFGLGLISLTLLGLVLVEKFGGSPRITGSIELIWSAAILVTYLGCIRLIYRFEKRSNEGHAPVVRHRVEPSLYVAVLVLAAVIMVASWWLTRIGDVLSMHPIEALGGRTLGATFVGACFLALATSLPELTTSVAAVRLGNLDLALGNLFGSNMFNIAVIPAIKGVSLASGNWLMMPPGSVQFTQHMITGVLAIMLTTIAVGGLTYKSNRRMMRRFGFDAILIVVVYLGGMAFLLMGSGS